MASFKMQFINFEKSLALETYTEKHIGSLIRRLDSRPGQNKSIEVHFKLDAKAPYGTVKNNEVMIFYKYPGIANVFHIKKKGNDLRVVLLDAIKATETVIRRASEKMEGGRKTLGKTKKSVRTISRT